MKVEDEEMQAMTDRLKEWSMQMDVLAAKQEAAAVAAKNYARELDELRVRYRTAAQQLRQREVKETGLGMWENIGDGG